MIKLPLRCAVVVCLLLVSRFVAAQSLPIHNHPQKAAYASSAEWPTISAQCHWRPSENPVSSTMPMLGHTHLDLTGPLYADLAGPVVASFAVKLFHTDGTVSLNMEGVRDIIWDATGTSTPPNTAGDPMGLKVWTGHLTIDPTIHTRWFTAHGWWAPDMTAVTHFTNGDIMITEFIPSFYAVLDPTQPDSGGTPLVSTRCNPISAHHAVSWGSNIVETNRPDLLPIAPLSTTAWPVRLVTAGYGALTPTPPALFEQRADLDLHNLIPGRLLLSVLSDEIFKDINPIVTLDPVDLGSGSHKMAFIRKQVSADNTEEVNSLLVFDVVVGGSVPPPPTCTPPAVLQNGVCVTPPPPSSWVPVTVQPQQNGDHMRLMRPDGKVVILPDAVVP